MVQPPDNGVSMVISWGTPCGAKPCECMLITVLPHEKNCGTWFISERYGAGASIGKPHMPNRPEGYEHRDRKKG